MSTSSNTEPRWQPWVMPQMQNEAPDEPTTPSPSSEPEPESESEPAEAALPAETLRQALEEIEAAKLNAIEQGRTQGYEQGYEKGLARGHEQGLAQAHNELQAQLTAQSQQFEQLLATAEKAFQQLDEQVGEQMIALACALAEHIVQVEIQQQRHDLVPLIQRALRHTLEEQPVVIRLHPEDAALLRLDERWQAHWQIEENEQISRGGFTLHAPWGQVDADLQTRWQALVNELLPQSEAPDERS